MDTDRILDVADLCLALDRKAGEIYSRLAESTRSLELGRFWLELAEQAQSQIPFWDSVKAVMAEYRLPDIFDDPIHTCQELTQLLSRVSALAECW